MFTGTSHFTERDKKTGRLIKKVSDTTYIHIITDNSTTARQVNGYAITSITQDARQKYFFAICSDGKGRLLDRDLNHLAGFESTVPFHKDKDEFTYAEFANSSDTIVTITSIGYLIRWTTSGEKLETIDAGIAKNKKPTKYSYTKGYGSFSISPDGGIVSIFTGESYASIYNFQTRSTEKIYYNREGDIYSLIRHGKLIDNGKFLVTQNGFGIDIWNVAEKEHIIHIDCDPVSFDVYNDETKILVNDNSKKSFEFLLPKGIENWKKCVEIASLTDENSTKYELKKLEDK